MKRLFVLLFMGLIVHNAVGARTVQNEQLRDQLLGNILKSRLEMMHFTHKKVDDDLSEKAFKLYLDKVDHGKQYLLEGDVKSLKQYEKSLDDAILSGDFKVVRDTSKIYKMRIKEVERMVADILKTPFDFTKKEYLESDPEKRKYCKNKEELKELWRKTLKYNILIRFTTMMEEQKEAKANKDANQNKNKKKNEKSAKGKVNDAEKEMQKLLVMTSKDMEKDSREKVAKNYKRIFSRMQETDHDEELDNFFNSVSMVFDPHTNYLPPQKKEDFDIEMSGTLEGIGALLKEDGDYIKVVKVIPGSASWKQKELEAEDTILKVAQGEEDPVDIVNMRINDAVKLIRGEKGTEVRLTVKKPNGIIKVVPITRDIVEIEEAYAKGAILEFKGQEGLKYGYIYLPKFYRDFEAQAEGREGRNCTDDVRIELEKFTKAGVNGVILDLRNNGGGALEDARLMSGLFVKNGPVVQVKQSDGRRDILEDTDKSISYNGHMVVLLNRFSASASEILAGALQDYERALVMGGDHSHGKGTVQVFLNLDRGLTSIAEKFMPLGALKITIQKFYRVTGGSTQYKGVIPDIILPDPYEYLETGEKYLDYSLGWDEVKPLEFEKWNKSKLFRPEVITGSKKRVEKSGKFQKMSKSIELLTKRRDQTVLALNMEESNLEQKKIKEEMEKFKVDEVSPLISVSVFENKKATWLKRDPPVKKDTSAEKKSLDDGDDEEKAEDWVDNLYTDPYIEESLFVLKDLATMNKKY